MQPWLRPHTELDVETEVVKSPPSGIQMPGTQRAAQPVSVTFLSPPFLGLLDPQPKVSGLCDMRQADSLCQGSL